MSKLAHSNQETMDKIESDTLARNLDDFLCEAERNGIMSEEKLQAEVKANRIRTMVDRFLCWKLPADFAPDNHISFNREEMARLPEHCWPVGTNLFTADQAREMIQYILGAQP